MTEPITPPPELVHQLRYSPGTWLNQITIAYQSGADHELEACVEWVSIQLNCTDQEHLVPHLRAARRPKPPSLKEQALEALERMDQLPTTEDKSTIRRALEALDD